MGIYLHLSCYMGEQKVEAGRGKRVLSLSWYSSVLFKIYFKKLVETSWITSSGNKQQTCTKTQKNTHRIKMFTRLLQKDTSYYLKKGSLPIVKKK